MATKTLQPTASTSTAAPLAAPAGVGPPAAAVPTAASSSEDLMQHLLPDGPGLDILVKMREPIRTATWMSCLFDTVEGENLEQVAFWKLYQAQFQPHTGKQPLATASAVIKAAEERFKPDRIEGTNGQPQQYVLRNIRIKSVAGRTQAMSVLQNADSDLKRMRSSPGTNSTPAAKKPSGPATAPSTLAVPATSAASLPVSSAAPAPASPGQGSPVPPRKRPASALSSSTSTPTTKAPVAGASSGLPAAANPFVARATPAISSPAVAPSPVLTNGSSPSPAIDPSDLLDSTDAARIAEFPEPHRARLWLAALYEADDNKAEGTLQVTLWAMYEQQFAPHAKVPLLSATKVVRMVQSVIPSARVKVQKAEGKSAYLIGGMRLRESKARVKALDHLLDFRSSGAQPPAPTPERSPHVPPLPSVPTTVSLDPAQLSQLSQVLTSVQSLSKGLDEVRKDLRKIDETSKQEALWNSARRLNAAAIAPSSSLYTLTMLRPPQGHPPRTPHFPKTVAEAEALNSDQMNWLLRFYGQETPYTDQQELKAALFGFIGCPFPQWSKS